MSIKRESGYLAWLSAAAAEQRDRITSLLARLTGMGPAGSMKPSLFKKFLGLVDEVAEAKDRENEILNEIEDVEKRHRFNRDHGSLRQATPHSGVFPALNCEPGEEQPQRGLMWLLTLWALFGGRPSSKKNQDLTVD